MLNHVLEIVFKLTQEIRRVDNKCEILEVFIKPARYSPIKVHTAESFLGRKIQLFLEGLQSILNQLLVTIFALPMEEFIQLKVIIIAVSIALDVLEESVLVLIVLPETEEMLNSIECFVIVKEEHELVLLAFRDVLQLIHRIIGSERERFFFLHRVRPLVRR